ncbi:MAG: hypothetical protein WB643_10440 [Candidatus Bathyarchaeia archaeon]
MVARSIVPLLPRNMTRLVPLAAFAATLITTLAELLPPDGMLRELGSKPETVTPDGSPEAESATDPAKLEIEVPVIVMVPELP